ncbi:MAG: hypoxanthine phosphoribosyltransferase [Flavobacteriales bacterium]|nr:hypoxanthine phosphoribosyltransferase [Flavobacteriales bacterium]
MADTIQLHDLEFVPYFSEDEVRKTVAEMAVKVNQRFQGKSPLFVVVLNGAFMFGSDLIKQITVNCEVSFLRVSSYRGTSSTGEVKEMMPIGTDVAGRDVVFLEDIVDTGKTMGEIKQKMLDAGASSVSICTLLFKPDAFQGSYRIDFIGQEIPDRFVVGYGLDYDGLGRNLPAIYQIKPNN